MAYDYSAAMRFWVNANNDDIFAGTMVMSMLNNGNVGIGTSDPGSKLEITGTNPFLRINNDSTSDSGIKISYGNSNTHGLHLLYNPGSAVSYIDNTYPTSSGQVYGDMYFRQNAGGTMTPRIVIKAESGNVGIGVTSPTYNLEVSGSGYISGSLTVAGTITAQKLNVQQITSSVVYSSGSNIFGNSLANTQTFTGSIQATGSSHYLLGDVGIGTTSPDAKLAISVTPSAAWMNLINGNETAFRLTTYNNGTNNGSSTYAFKHGLYYNSTENAAVTFYRGDSSVGGFLAFTTNNGAERMRIDTNGNVGIGTTSPSYKLHVDSNTDSLIRVSNGTETYLQSTYFGYDAGYDVIQIGDTYGKGSTGVSVALGIDPKIITGGSFYGNEIALPEITEFITANGPSGSATDWNQNVLVISGSSIGIGTGAPAYKLDVAGTSRSDMHIFRSNQSAPTADAFIFRPADNTVALGTANTERMRISSAGNVGIGNTNPQFPLHVGNGSSSEQIMIQSNGGGATLRFYDSVNDSGGDRYQMIGHLDTTSKLQFSATSSGEIAMSINSDGRIGMGTTNPAVKLTVVGAISSSGATYVGGNLSVGTTYNGFAANIAGTTYVIGGSVWVNDGYGYVNASSGNTGFFPSASSDIKINSAGTTRLFIASGSGNVGVGTDSPIYKLQIAGSTYVNGGTMFLDSGEYIRWGNSTQGIRGVNDTSLEFVAGSSTRMYVSASGNVGIGTSSPESIVHIAQANSGGKTILYIDNNAGSALNNEATIKFSVDSGATVSNGGAEISTINVNAGSGNSDLTFKTFNSSTGLTEKLRITNNGNVGIGLTNPDTKLTVAGLTNSYGNVYGFTTFNGAAGGSAGWIDFGRLSIPQNGYNASISFYAGTGYNADNSQNAYATLFIRTSNGSSTDPNGFYFSAFASRFGRSSNFLTDIRIKPTGSNEYQIYGYTGLYSGVGYYKVEGAGINYTPTNTASSDPGSGSTAYVVPFEYRVLDNTTVSSNLYVNGNVGIGTTDPAYKLDVIGTARIGQNSNSSTAASLQITAGGNGYDSIVDFGYWDSFDAGIWHVGRKGSTGAFFISDYSSGPELNRLTITTGGNVGIGTTSPSQRLHVSGAIAIEAESTTTKYSTTFSGSLTTNTNIASVPTASFKAAFFDYYVASGSVNMRAGTVMSVHNNSTSRYTDTSTGDIGNTSAVDFSTSIVAGSLVLTANISSGTWEVKTSYRAL